MNKNKIIDGLVVAAATFLVLGSTAHAYHDVSSRAAAQKAAGVTMTAQPIPYTAFMFVWSIGAVFLAALILFGIGPNLVTDLRDSWKTRRRTVRG